MSNLPLNALALFSLSLRTWESGKKTRQCEEIFLAKEVRENILEFLLCELECFFARSRGRQVL
jgi:hypothetical protein